MEEISGREQRRDLSSKNDMLKMWDEDNAKPSEGVRETDVG